MSEPHPEVRAVAEAIQQLANVIADEPELVDNAVVVWESVSFDEDGETQRCIRYAVPTDNFTMSGTIGLLDAGKRYLERDLFGDDDAD